MALAADRLQQIGTPPDIAEASDWDRVSEEFVGLRGFGNVAWYPISSVPVRLGDGAKYFTAIAAQKQRQSQAMVSMQVTEEFFGGAPNLAVLNGLVFAVTAHFPARYCFCTRHCDLSSTANAIGVCFTQPVPGYAHAANRQWRNHLCARRRQLPLRRRFSRQPPW